MQPGYTYTTEILNKKKPLVMRATSETHPMMHWHEEKKYEPTITVNGRAYEFKRERHFWRSLFAVDPHRVFHDGREVAHLQVDLTNNVTNSIRIRGELNGVIQRDCYSQVIFYQKYSQYTLYLNKEPVAVSETVPKQFKPIFTIEAQKRCPPLGVMLLWFAQHMAYVSGADASD